MAEFKALQASVATKATTAAAAIIRTRQWIEDNIHPLQEGRMAAVHDLTEALNDVEEIARTFNPPPTRNIIR